MRPKYNKGRYSGLTSMIDDSWHVDKNSVFRIKPLRETGSLIDLKANSMK